MNPTGRGFMKARVRWFLDRPETIEKIGKRQARAMMRIGAWMRKTMRRSMRKGTGPQPHSLPGEVPRWHNAGQIKRNIDFSYSPSLRSLVVGPIKLPINSKVRPVSKTVPQLLNEGGTANSGGPTFVIKDKKSGRLVSLRSGPGQRVLKKWRQQRMAGGGQRKKDRRYEFVMLPPGSYKYEARPFTAPVLQKAIHSGALAQAWSTF